MKKVLILAALCLMLPDMSKSCENCKRAKVYYDANPIKLIEGLGPVHLKVSTDNAEAQCFFDQGLAFVYGFHHDEGIRSFKRALEIEPNLAMAYWGIAYANGPNYNIPVDSARELLAYEAIQKAVTLSSGATPLERDLISALAVRYTNAPRPDYRKLDLAYRDAIKSVHAKYPNNPHVAVLYAESIMLLNPWKLHTLKGEPVEGTAEAIAVLEEGMKHDSNHIGLHHYYIHAVEASTTPERALPSAKKLEHLAPSAGHLVHMPAHIYQRVGDYESGCRQNAIAVKTDSIYLNEPSVYPMLYYNHNAQFYAVGRLMQGRYAEAMPYANEVRKNIVPIAKDMPMLESFAATPLLIQVRGYKWDEILKQPKPDSALVVTTTMWHFARAMALASTGKVDEAKAEYLDFESATRRVPPSQTFSMSMAHPVFEVARHLLHGKISAAQKRPNQAIVSFQRAVQAQDTLYYDEPESFYITARESLGGALLSSGKYQDAEQVFREDLKLHPNSARSLFGLYHALHQQGRTGDAAVAWNQFQTEWKNADITLEISLL